jgi:OOP family OmpA-OmpF porin
VFSQGYAANTPVEHHGCPLPQYPVSVKPAEPVRAEVIILSDDVLFTFNQSDLTPSARSQLDEPGPGAEHTHQRRPG